MSPKLSPAGAGPDHCGIVDSAVEQARGAELFGKILRKRQRASAGVGDPDCRASELPPAQAKTGRAGEAGAHHSRTGQPAAAGRSREILEWQGAVDLRCHTCGVARFDEGGAAGLDRRAVGRAGRPRTSPGWKTSCLASGATSAWAYQARSRAAFTALSRRTLWSQGNSATTCCTNSRSGQASARARMYLRFRADRQVISGKARPRSTASWGHKGD